jgi:hypothetical protein
MNELKRCAVIDCKGCGAPMVLHVLSTHDPLETPLRVDFLVHCRNFVEVCGICRQSHAYGQADVRVVPLPNISAPIGWQAHSYHKACTPLEQSEKGRESE